MKDDKVYLHHIIDAVEELNEFVKDMDEEDFEGNKLVKAASIRQIQIIGEAAKKVSQQLKDNNSGIPWKDIAGMRDKVIHDYFGVDYGAVWQTIKSDIPGLVEQIKKLI